MPLSAMLTSLPLDFAAAVHQAAALDFTLVDVVGQADRSLADRHALAESGVFVSCVALGRGLPITHTLDAPSLADRRAAVAASERQLIDAAQLGATRAYIVCGTDCTSDGIARFTDACIRLTEFAARCQVRLCVEHCPGRSMPTAASVLDWLDQMPHAPMRLLLDVGHCLISRENPAAVIRRAGPQLGYVHLDDNDGAGDLHWPLLAGRLAEAMLQATLAALEEQAYDAALALELNASNSDPVEALRQGRQLVLRLQASV
jgi:sugar phosphate isomerase/epimerase